MVLNLQNYIKIAKLFGIKPNARSLAGIVFQASLQHPAGQISAVLGSHSNLYDELTLEVSEMKDWLLRFLEISYDQIPEPEEVEDFWDTLYIYVAVSQLINKYDPAVFAELALAFTDTKLKKLFKICYRDLSHAKNKTIDAFVNSAFSPNTVH